MRFDEYSCGLYIFHAGSQKLSEDMKPPFVLLLQTVEDMKKLYTNEDIDRADKTRLLHGPVGQMGEKFFQDVLDRGLIINCPR